jgi:pimeloyl-ACP methyl ester carboxylesterase
MNNSGDTVILLHGFPETSRMWYKLIKVLDSKNFRVIAPDQRGYSSGARPPKIKDYKINKLTKDIIDIADAFKLTNFHLVGHDWGAAVGWVMSSIFKNRIISYSALSVPHLDAFSKAISNDKIQKKKSYYMMLFRIRFLPELYFKIFNYHNLKILWRSSDDLEIKNYLTVFREKNALKSALHWYRATNLKSTRKIGDILVPTLLIYGEKDLAIGQKAVNETKKHLKSTHLIKIINSSHWLIQDSFDIVSKNILNHIETNK